MSSRLALGERNGGEGLAHNLQTNFRKRSKRTMIKSFLRDETGLELSEYAVAAALIALAVVGVFTTLGGNIKGVINNLAGNIK
jgi:pilus assembly protein Flp/PilA